MTGDVVVHVAPGTYYTTSTVAFTAADSGTNGHDVIYQAEGVYQAPVDASVHGNTLYENGTRAIVARYPNYVYNPEHPSSWAPYLKAVSGTSTTLTYRGGELDPAAWPQTTVANHPRDVSVNV
jgi:hypothetical protein